MLIHPAVIFWVSLWTASSSMCRAQNVGTFEVGNSSSNNICPATSSVNARSEAECAILCLADYTCMSCSYLPASNLPATQNGNRCLISDLNNCTLADGVPKLNKKISTTVSRVMPLNSRVKFMQRLNTTSEVNFSRPWTDYENGFGDANGEFWLGLRNIQALIDSINVTWRIEFKLLLTGGEYFVEFSNFRVYDASTNYWMNYSSLANASSQLDRANIALPEQNVGFSTYDRDNDLHSSYFCAREYMGNGGFWVVGCGNVWFTSPKIQPPGNGRRFSWYLTDPVTNYRSDHPLLEIRMYLIR